MSDYKTDEEKAEDLKAWWRANGNSVIAGVALAIAGLFGWEYWQGMKVSTAEAAATLYTESQTTDDMAVAAQKMQALQNDYPTTPYAALASLESAKTYAEKGEYEPAAAALSWVKDNSKEQELKDVAQIRLARVLVAMGKYDEALALANQKLGAAYESLLEELKGDIYSAQKQAEQARTAYERAILTNQAGSNELIQLKLDNLGKGA